MAYARSYSDTSSNSSTDTDQEAIQAPAWLRRAIEESKATAGTVQACQNFRARSSRGSMSTASTASFFNSSCPSSPLLGSAISTDQASELRSSYKEPRRSAIPRSSSDSDLLRIAVVKEIIELKKSF